MLTLRWQLHPMGLIACLWLAALCLIAATAGCAPAPLTAYEPAAQPETPPPFTATACRFPVPEGQTVDCGDLLVPERYDKPQGRQLRLHVAVVKSSSETPAPEPLVILYGGPGAHALDRLESTVARFAAVLATRDIILMDQRGVGYSAPSLNCPELDDFNLVVIDEELDREQAFARRLLVYEQCRDRLLAEGVALTAYSAAGIAADVARLRAALDYDGWHLYGVSYGARLALLVMRDHPDGLRSVVLDSVYPPEVDLAAETATMHTHALATLFAATEATHPAFEDALYALVDDLDAAPVAVPVADPRGRDLYYLQSFDGTDLLQLTVNLARWPQAVPHLPQLVEDIAAGDYRDLAQLLQPAVGDQQFSEGMNLSVNCQEMDATALPPPQNAVVPRVHELVLADVEQRAALCALWLGEGAGPVRQPAVASETPALVLVGEQDAVVPAAWSEQATAGLTHRVLLTLPGSGHGVMTADTCARDVVATFLQDPDAVAATACAGEEARFSE